MTVSNRIVLVAAVFAAIVIGVLLANRAKADSYVTAFGGANWDDVINAEGVSDNAGYVFGGALGMSVKSLPGVRIEGELAFRQNDIDIDWYFPLTAKHSTVSLMGNVVWDVPVALGPVHPYVLGGVGYARTEAVLEDISIASVESSGVAWQLGVGVQTELAEGVKAGIGYRYFAGPEIEVFGTQISDGTNQSVVATLSFAL